MGVQTWRLRTDQGMLASMKAQLESFVERDPGIPSWRSALAHLCCELGLRAEARRHFDQLAVTRFAALPQDRYWIAGTCLAAEVCAYLGDTQNAEILYALLQPFADRYAVVGPTTACFGSVAHYLGLLASTMARWSAADDHFQNALAANAHIKPMHVRTQYAYASMLIKHGRKSDRKSARDLLSAALAAPVLTEMLALKKAVKILLSRAKRK
jgi:hypothetical protein